MQPNGNRRQSYDNKEVQLRQMHFGIKKEYAKLLQNERRIWIKDERVKYEDIEAAIITYFCQIVDNKSYRDIPELCTQGEKNIDNLCKVINENTSWFNFELLEITVDDVGDKHLLETYKNGKLKEFLKESLFDIPAESFSPSEAEYYRKAEAVFKCVDDKIDLDLTGLHVQVITENIRQLFGKQCIIFEGYRRGCVELLFGIPEILFETSPPDSPLHQYTKWNKDTKEYRITAPLSKIL